VAITSGDRDLKKQTCCFPPPVGGRSEGKPPSSLSKKRERVNEAIYVGSGHSGLAGRMLDVDLRESFPPVQNVKRGGWRYRDGVLAEN